MKVKDLVALLQKADQDADVIYSMFCCSEYGEYIEEDGELKCEDVVIDGDQVKLCVGLK